MSQKWFVFQKDLDLPIYIRFDLERFESTLVAFLSSMKFTELSDKETESAKERVSKENNARVLELKVASPVVASQIRSSLESDTYGPESIIPKDGYRVYRFKNEAIIIYSFGASEWTAGCFKNFGSGDNDDSYRVVVNRYLSWALGPMGIVGFWGVPVDEGAVILRQKESRGEALFIDILNRRVLSIDGVEEITSEYKILRLDKGLRNREVKMKSEQLASFLTQYTSYLDFSGASIPVRQGIKAIVSRLQGMIYPEDSFKPRTDLSL